MARILPNEEIRLLSKVSKLYYEEGLNQDEIVLKLQLSRSKISRLLKQAREEGIVKITVKFSRLAFILTWKPGWKICAE